MIVGIYVVVVKLPLTNAIAADVSTSLPLLSSV